MGRSLPATAALLLLLLPCLGQAFVSMRPALPIMGRCGVVIRTPATGVFPIFPISSSRLPSLPLAATPTPTPTPSTLLPSARGGGGSGKGKGTKATLIAAVKSLYFPVYVLLAGLLGVTRPQLYNCLNETFITRALSAVMVLMGMTLSVDDFARICASKRAVALGWCAQFSIMPTMALAMSRLFRLPPHLAAGVVLVGT